MPIQQISNGYGYDTTTKSQVTASNLNQHVDNAIVLAGVITGQNENTATAQTDQVLIEKSGVLYRQSKQNLTKTLVSDTITYGGTVIPYDSWVPTGAVMPFAMATAPTGWAICDGSTHNITEESGKYANIYAAIGNLYGGTDGTNFKLPDLRGQFIRGLDTFTASKVTTKAYTSTGTLCTVTSVAHGLKANQTVLIEDATAGTGYNGVFRIYTVTADTFTFVGQFSSSSGTLSYTCKNFDTGRSIGSSQADLIRAHKHVAPDAENFTSAPFGNSTGSTVSKTGDATYAGERKLTSDGYGLIDNQYWIGNETRPVNIALNYCIKL